MSEFWDKNKGSIASGLKTAGKYGYQGTKYVAKTGYKAGKKNLNSKKKSDQAKKDGKDGDEEEEEEREYPRQQYMRDPATLPPPPVRGAPGQYPAQYQPAYQQPQYQQPSYPQPYQQPPYQQPQYQQPQYQQPPYQQPQYPQPQYPQPQYQQPQYPQPQYQQPAYQQPQYQPQYQAPPQALPAPVAVPPVSEVYSPVPPNINPQVASPQPLAAPGTVQPPVPPSDGARQAYNRSGLPTPALPGREVQAPNEPMSTGSSEEPAKSPVPGVTPYEYGSLEAKRLAARLPMKSVDLTALPPPPTHRDRSTPDLVSSPTESARRTSHQEKSGSTAGSIKSATRPVVASPPPELETAGNETPTRDLSAPAPAPMLPGRGANPSATVAREEPPSEPETPAKDTEEVNRGIAGRFDYEVNVGYAPPPKPHRNVPDVTTKPVKRPVIPMQNATSHGSPAPPVPPLSKRPSTSLEVNTNVAPATPNRTFEPPPKPFRRQEGSQTDQSSKNSSRPSLPVPQASDNSLRMKDISSFPPPPLRPRPSVRSVVSTQDEDSDQPPRINPRGRLSSDALPVNGEPVTGGDSDIAAGKKKAPPPAVKPKPKGLSSRSSTSLEHSDDRANASEISALTEELANVKLRKSGSKILSNDTTGSSEKKKSPPPIVPRKSDTLKHVPPVPMKASFLKSNAHSTEQTDSTNPFELYLKDAVPAEENRFHK